MITMLSLKIFITAAEEKNFSRVARKLYLSQSAISQSIRALENHYGVELFVRRGRSVQLSEAGESILPVAREALNAMHLLQDSLVNAHREIGGQLLLGCSTSAGRYLMPVLLSMFQEKYPAVNSHLHVMSRETLLERLLNENIPFGITSRSFDHHEIECTPLFDDHIQLIVHPSHPWASFGHAMPADLLDQPIIMRESTSGTLATILDGLKKHGISYDMLRLTMELGSAEAIEMAVERGVGIAFVSEMVAARGLAMGRICKVVVPGLELQRTVWLARLVGFPFTRVQSLFWQFAQEMRQQIDDEIWHHLTDFSPTSKVLETQ